jgi:hypothetical protein
MLGHLAVPANPAGGRGNFVILGSTRICHTLRLDAGSCEGRGRDAARTWAGGECPAHAGSAYSARLQPFCLGAILFYYLFYKSRVVPRVLSLWGLIAVSLVLIGTLFAICGHEVPLIVYLPYVPFEFVIGVWILVKGINEGAAERSA